MRLRRALDLLQVNPCEVFEAREFIAVIHLPGTVRYSGRRFHPTSSQHHTKSQHPRARKPDQIPAGPIAGNTLKLFLICPAHFRLFYFQFICTRCCLLIFVANIARSRNHNANTEHPVMERARWQIVIWNQQPNLHTTWMCANGRGNKKRSIANNRKEMAANLLPSRTKHGEKIACERASREKENPK